MRAVRIRSTLLDRGSQPESASFKPRSSGGSTMRVIKSALLSLALLGAAHVATRAVHSVLSYRVGPYAAGGSGYYGGAIDYWTLVNMGGGINGVKLLWRNARPNTTPPRAWVLRAAEEEEQRRDSVEPLSPASPPRALRSRGPGQDSDDYLRLRSRDARTAASTTGCFRSALLTGIRWQP
jgi:hypothetical protein